MTRLVKGEKKLKTVNSFRAPDDWYQVIVQIAEERRMTVGGAIQFLCGLGLPVYKRIRKSEELAIQSVIAEPLTPYARLPQQPQTALTLETVRKELEDLKIQIRAQAHSRRRSAIPPERATKGAKRLKPKGKHSSARLR